MPSASVRSGAALFLGICALVAVYTVIDEDSPNGVVLSSQKVPVGPAKKAVAAKTAAQEPNGVAANPGAKATMDAANSGVSTVAAAPATGNFPSLAKKFSKGVVQIMVVKAKHQWLSPHKPPSTEEVSGSGWFVENKHLGKELANSKDIHIVTNAHVAMDAVRLTIRLPKTGLLPIHCEVVGLSPPDQHDLALLRVKDRNVLLQALERKLGKDKAKDGMIHLMLGDSDGVQAGEKLMALGYPEGLPGVKSTLGVMSGYQEMSRKLYMQMTTPINPGNSGGPLLSSTGEVIGVNTAGIEGSENIGFSIPSAVLKAVLPVLATHRVYVRPMFGIVLNPLGDKVNHLFNMPKGARGEYVAKVYKGAIAHDSGMKAGDILYEIDGMPVSRRGQMFLKAINAYVTLDGYLGRVPLNHHVAIKVWRQGKSHELKMQYKETPATAIPKIHEAALNKKVSTDYQIRGGLVFTPLTQNYVESMTTPVSVSGGAVVPAPDLMKYGRYPHDRKESKVVIADVVSSSLAEATKVFDAAMVVSKINDKPVSNMEELCDALATPKKNGDTEWLTVLAEDGTFGAMPWKDALDDDKKLVEMKLFSPTECGAKAPTAKKEKMPPKP